MYREETQHTPNEARGEAVTETKMCCKRDLVRGAECL